MARQLIESMTGPWQPSDYRDTYTDRVDDLIKAKKNNEEFQPADEAPPGTTVMDLTEALRASVEAAKKTAGGKRGGRRRTAKQEPGPAEPARKARSREPAAKKAPDKKACQRPTRKATGRLPTSRTG
jgi:DNA end-binding protein Ku